MFKGGSLSVVLLNEIMIGIEFDRFLFVYAYRCKCTFWESSTAMLLRYLKHYFLLVL
jgi:hypothetical protein